MVEALVEVAAANAHQLLGLAVEEVVRARDDFLVDDDAALGLQLVDERLHVLRLRHAVGIAMDDQAGRGAGREEGEVELAGGRGNRDEALDFRTAHQQLHADPGAERDAGDPAGARVRIDRLNPIERGRRIRQLVLAVINALAAADAAEIEPQNREAALREHVIELIHDRVVHRAAELRMRVEHDADRGILGLGRVKTAFETAGRAGKNDFRHNMLVSF